MKRFFLLMAIILLSSSGFISIEASAQTNERKVYSCAFDGYVNMREDPSYSAKKVGKFNNGPEGAVLLEHLGDWTKIDVSGTIGYVPTKYIQETPTIAYTGDVSVEWLEGIWKQGGTSLLIYDNGTWERGYDYEQAHGKYVLQNNEIKFIPTMNQDIVLDDVLPINREENQLGDYERGEYLTQEEKDEFKDDEDFSWDYGALTKEEFRARGKRLLETIEGETNSNPQFASSSIINEPEEDSSVPLTGMEWIHGDWKGATYDFLTHEDTGPVYLRITPTYYQLSYDSPISDDTEKVKYTLKKEVNEFGVVKYWISEDEGICFMNDPDSPTISIEGGNWVYSLSKDEKSPQSFFDSRLFKWLMVALLVVLGILLVLWLARLIKKWYLRSKDTIAAKAQNAKEKAITLGGKAKEKAIEIGGKAKEKAIEYGEIAKEKASSVSEEAKAMLADASNKTSKKKLSTPTWLLIIGAYMALFWDYPLGLFIIVLALAYILAKKFVPSKTEQLLNTIKDKMSYFDSRPILKRGLIWLIVGLVVFRSFSGFIGAIIILASIITIILNKFSPLTAEKIDAFINGRICNPIKNLWNKRWLKIAVIALLVILPLITIPPQNNALEFTPVGAELQEAKIDRQIERAKDDDVEVGSYDYYRIQLWEIQKEGMRAQSRYDWDTYHECERAYAQLKAEAHLKYPAAIEFF